MRREGQPAGDQDKLSVLAYTLGGMDLDDELCYCYHVSMRKAIRYAQRIRPQRPSQMTGCLDAGTGCGWCVPFLVRIAEDPDRFDLTELKPEEYACKRKNYIRTDQPKNTFDSQEPRDGSTAGS